MGQDLGTEINKYREMLAREPNSYCFAPLADLYRKSGLLDDAISVARRGCELHPDYVGGYLALGRACLEKGLNDDSRTALEKVLVITPDNLLAQKLLSRIYLEQGDARLAEKSLLSVLGQSPDDLETRALLDALVKQSADEEFEIMSEDEDILEDLEIIEELSDDDLLEFDVDAPPQAADDSETEFSSPMLTVTMAELYLSQGFTSKALSIYREMLAADPHNDDVQKRILALTETLGNDAVGDRDLPADREANVPEATTPERCLIRSESTNSGVVGDKVVETLEQWLEAIKRRQ
jgi:tetratricopeptide (TPR) repeat protein